MRVIFITLFTFLLHVAFSQEVSKIDSLHQLILNEKDSLRIAQLQIELGQNYRYQNDFLQAQKHINRAGEFIAESQTSYKAKLLFELGMTHFLWGNNTEAIQFFNASLLIENGLQKKDVVTAYVILGNISSSLGNFEESVQSYKMALQKSKEIIGDNEFSYIHNNLGIVYMKMKAFDSARIEHNISLSIRLKKGYTFALGQTYNNIGMLNYQMGEYDSAMYYFQKGLDFRLKSEEHTWTSVVESQINIAKAEVAKGMFRQAKTRLMKSLEECIKKNNPGLELRAVEEMMNLSAKTKDFENALNYSKRYHFLNDSLYGVSQKEEAIRLSSMYKYEKIRMADSMKTAERDLMNEMMWAKEKENNQIIRYSLLTALLLTMGILALIYRNFINNKKKSAIILQQKKDVELQQIEIQSQHQELTKTHQEIKDSINYAKRLQEAILPSLENVNHVFPNNFVFYQPKDVVSGDFYWMERKKEGIYFAVADCTGHGVPGAMVSVVCSNALNQAVNEYGLNQPNEILNKTRELVIETFSKSGNDVQDGMDIALISLKKNKLTFSGANSSIFLVMDEKQLMEEHKSERTTVVYEGKALVQLKGNKQAVGLTSSPQPFTQVEIEMQKGNQIYLFSDGFVDQFGSYSKEIRDRGGKKFKYASFRKLIIENSNRTMQQQGVALKKTFDKWKGELEQVDDVCVVGFRIDAFEE